jgi:hypothetical protein
MKIAQSGNWLSAKVGDQLLMMSAEKGHYIGMTAVGARIWEIIERPHDIDSLCTVLEAEFEVDPTVCRAEVETFLKDMAAHGAVAIDSELSA